MKRWLQRNLAIWRVRRGHAECICAPGQWVVWRDGDAVLSKTLGGPAPVI